MSVILTVETFKETPMKRNIIFTIVFVVLLFTLTVMSFGETYGDLTYEVKDGEVTVTGCDKEVTSVTVPAEIDGYPVTKIKNSVFMNCKKLNRSKRKTDYELGAFFHEAIRESGKTYQQIAEEMGKSPKAIDNALQRIKAKVRCV